jgi:hypothetical protein
MASRTPHEDDTPKMSTAPLHCWQCVHLCVSEEWPNPPNLECGMGQFDTEDSMRDRASLGKCLSQAGTCGLFKSELDDKAKKEAHLLELHAEWDRIGWPNDGQRAL